MADVRLTDTGTGIVGATMARRLNPLTVAAILVLLPSVLAIGLFVYGFIAWTGAISLTTSRFAPDYSFVGFSQYAKLWANDRWITSVVNLGIFSFFFIGLSGAVGLLLAILLDQRIRMENAIRTIYLYPMAVSFIVTGIAWKWLLTPDLGIEKLVRGWGFGDFKFDWIVDPRMAIYTIVIAAFWQSVGFVMAILLAALRGVDGEIIRAARVDGAGAPRIYWSIIIPMLRPAFLSVVVILLFQALRSFDLVVALTGGGPGFASDLPTTFMFKYTFGRNQLAQGAASAIMITLAVAAVMIPYLYSELRHERRR
jgi:glucose/mannose transport system permease protein